jgi:large subunit ribosomal protein L13
MAIRKRTIDANGKSLGRLASQIALELQGKSDPAYARNSDEGDVVIVTNLKDVKFTGGKIDDKKYYSYSGYPGGLKTRSLSELWKKNPAEVLRRTVWNMLPKNTLREKQIDRLIVK